MITGEKTLRQIYPNLEEEQYQPIGIDLTLNKVAELKYEDGKNYGLFKNKKVLPKQSEMKTVNVQFNGRIAEVFLIRPNIPYIVTTGEKIKISKYAGQFYLPRSSLLRAGLSLQTALGDAGFEGHLSFLLINHTNEFFYIEKGVRFAQLVDISANNVEHEYDGDYNEK